MQIRRATLTDIDGINKLLYEVHKVHSDNRPIFVYVDNDDILGYTFCVFIKNNSNSLTDILTLYIDDLCVDENARGKKVGTTLYNYVLQFAKDAGCYNVTLNVWACNNSALKFYEKCGLSVQKIGMEKIL